jgi:AcrR family transcriptional regulator
MRLSKTRKAIVNAVMKDAILEAAGTVLQEHGVRGMTMERVATRAGLAAGSLYNYFDSKDDLLQFFHARMIEPFVQACEEIIGKDLPAPKKLEEILRLMLESSIKHKGLIQLLVESGQESNIRRNVRPRVLQILRSVFERGILEGTFSSHNPMHMARMFHGCCSELFELQAEGGASEEVNEYAGVLIEAIRNGFAIHIAKSPKQDKKSAPSSPEP